MANDELEEDSSIESVKSAEATPIESEVVNSIIISEDKLNYAQHSFSHLEDDEPVNVDLECDGPQDSFLGLECDEPVNAAVDDGLCSSSPVHAGGFFPDFYPVNGSILSSIKKCQQKISSPPNLVSHMLSPTVLRHKRILNFSQSFTENGNHADKSLGPRRKRKLVKLDQKVIYDDKVTKKQNPRKRKHKLLKV